MSTNAVLHVAVVMPFPAPYRVPLLNRLNKIPGIRLTGLFARPTSDAQNEVLAQLEIPYRLFFMGNLYGWNQHGERVGFPWSPGLLTHLMSAKYDALIMLGWTVPNTVIARVCGGLRHIPTVVWDDSIPHAPGRLKAKLLPLIRRYFGSFDGYLASSDWCREYMISLGARTERMVLFPQVVDNDYFQREADCLRTLRTALKREMGISTTRIVLFVGQLILRKGVDVLLKAFEQTAARDPDVSLVLVGEGALRAELQIFCDASPFGKRIFILPFAPQNELPKYYAIADLFVLPSRYDTFGLVVNEAMASRLPVVATTRVGAVANLIEDGVNGRVVEPGNVTQLAQAMSQLLSDDTQRAVMGEKAFARIQTWSVEEAAQAFVECLEQCRVQK